MVPQLLALFGGDAQLTLILVIGVLLVAYILYELGLKFPDTSVRALAYLVVGGVLAGIINTGFRYMIQPMGQPMQFVVAVISFVLGVGIIMIPQTYRSYRETVSESSGH
jgi:urea transporter